MRLTKSGFILLGTLSFAAMYGCSSSSKEGTIGDVAKVDESTCRVCHATTIDPVSKSNIIEDFLGTKDPNTGAVITPASVHFQLPDGTDGAGCQGCHGGGAQHNGVGPIPYPNPLTAGRCNSAECHNNKIPASLTAVDFASQCNGCHGAKIHGIQFKDPQFYNDCIGCHSIVQTHPTANVVKDNNNGVRAITAEFTKWSHHVTGVNLQNAHCAACHLEGKVEGGKIVVDRTYHMADVTTHLRNSDTDADMQWNPAAPNHSTMDNFCMSCHDANGATSPASIAIRALMIPAAGKTASALNPFGDTISNRYDKMLRPAVVDVDTQFNTANPSHHGVKGPKYTGRTRFGTDRVIANPAAFAANSSAILWGKRSTIYDSVNATTGLEETTNKAFNALYVPLENAGGEAAPRTGAKSLGDDSTLHCGDCHTVGQWKPGTAQFFNLDGTVDTSKTSPAIGAHGSNNEYLLRNSKGTDERHTQDAYLKGNATGTVINPFTGQPIPNGNIVVVNPNAAFLVCFNCHSYSRYGSIYNATGRTGPHAGEYDASGRCNGVGNTIPFNGYTTGTATDGTQFISRFEGPLARYAATPAFAPGFPLNEANRPTITPPNTTNGEQNPDFGNVLGIQCLNCHNSGLENGYGGIHGSKVSTYSDGMGNTQTMRRFLPGLGNTKYVPGTVGGITGGTKTGPAFNSRNSVGFQNYSYVTGGVSNDTNWEQVDQHFRPDGLFQWAGAGCYTLGENATAATFGQKGLSVDGGATIPNAFGTWGGCDDHQDARGATNHGAIKRINRPVTY